MVGMTDAGDPTTADTWEHADDPDEIEELFPDVQPESEEDADRRRLERNLEARALDELNQAEEAEHRAMTEAFADEPNWQLVGETLADARVQLGISKREAARRAGLSDGAWRHLEKGVKWINRTKVHPNPKDENLIAAAKAVGLDPRILFDLARRTPPEALLASETPERLLEDLRRLSHADRDLVADLIRRLAGR